WNDTEVKLLFQMMESYYYDEEISDDDKNAFKETIVTPEYRNEKAYYRKVAYNTNGVSENVIGNNAFIEAKIKQYTIPKNIEYVGDTAFAYCEELEILEFEGKTMFGTFPIIECNNLRQIVVPNGLQSYYAACLPFYKTLITEKQHNEGT
ncbi:MAG: leucine-rich repeat protein, partial [Prevotella sp.]|nr:leucine-rich repeat protein [Prevotella sp.]